MLGREREQALGQADVVAEVQGAVDLVGLVTAATAALAAMRAAMQESSASSASGSSSGGHAPAARHAQTLDELTALTDAVGAAADRDTTDKVPSYALGAAAAAAAGGGDPGTGFRLLNELAAALKKLHSEAVAWDGHAKGLMPVKTTRSKGAKGGAEAAPLAAREDLEDALNRPIARAVRTPLYERVWNIAQDARGGIQALVDFFMPAKEEEEDEAEAKAAGASGDDAEEEDEDDGFKELAFAQSCALEEVKERCQLLPLEIREIKLILWAEVRRRALSEPFPSPFRALLSMLPVPSLSTPLLTRNLLSRCPTIQPRLCCPHPNPGRRRSSGSWTACPCPATTPKAWVTPR